MITCLKCGKENQDHYKFCLGCGAELPRAAAAKPFTAATPPQGVPAFAAPQPAAAAMPAPAPMPAAPAPVAASVPAAAPRPAAAPPAAPAGGTVTCPQCGHVNGTNNRFCASCGYNLGALAGASPSAAPAAPAAVTGSVPAIVLTALRADGSEAGTYRLPDAQVITLGRDTGSIFAGDSYLSPRHATFTRRNNALFIKDEDSLNGVYLKLRPNEPCLLEFGDLFRIGQEIIRLEELKGQGKSPDNVERFGSPAKGYIGRLALVIGRDTTGNSFPIPERGVHCGRERGDILFSEDGYVSGLHCSIAKAQDGK
ncbi:MAG TPA: FHA domain-containing protein, partial [Polyangiaceae bacterium]|nr:FHA domain-containing protein [Polyangiaceae bacterium]